MFPVQCEELNMNHLTALLVVTVALCLLVLVVDRLH